MDISIWMRRFVSRMQGCFGGRLVCVGLQGSRGRGEENDDSDIDVVVILDTLTTSDLEDYRAAVEDLPDRELLCGFVSGREELAGWDAGELFQFYHDTTVLYGDLDFLLPLADDDTIRRSLHLGACSIYHTCCHNYLHARSPEVLQDCCKSAFFVLRTKHYLETGDYIHRKKHLMLCLLGADREVLEALLAGEFTERFSEISGLLLAWSSKLIRQCADKR